MLEWLVAPLDSVTELAEVEVAPRRQMDRPEHRLPLNPCGARRAVLSCSSLRQTGSQLVGLHTPRTVPFLSGHPAPARPVCRIAAGTFVPDDCCAQFRPTHSAPAFCLLDGNPAYGGNGARKMSYTPRQIHRYRTPDESMASPPFEKMALAIDSTVSKSARRSSIKRFFPRLSRKTSSFHDQTERDLVPVDHWPILTTGGTMGWATADTGA